MLSGGSVLGVGVAWLVLYPFSADPPPQAYPIVFALALFFAVLSGLATTLLNEKDIPGDQVASGLTTRPRFDLKIIVQLGHRYWLTLVPFFLFSFANSSDAFLLLRLGDFVGTTKQVVLRLRLISAGIYLTFLPGRLFK
jgi:hypothetical protein